MMVVKCNVESPVILGTGINTMSVGHWTKYAACMRIRLVYPPSDGNDSDICTIIIITVPSRRYRICIAFKDLTNPSIIVTFPQKVAFLSTTI